MTAPLDLPTGSSLAGLTLRELLDRVAGGESGPGAGSAAGVAGAIAAALVAMVARRASESWPEAGGAAAQAGVLEERCLELARADAAAFADALAALDRQVEVEEPLRRTVVILLQLGEAAADVGELAALTAERCVGRFRADAAAAALLAEAAVKMVAALVRSNLTVTTGDERLDRIAQLQEAVARSVRQAAEAGP